MSVQALSSVLQSFSSTLQTTQAHEETVVLPSELTGGEATAARTSTPVDPEQLAQAMESIKQAIANVSDVARNLQFSIDEDTGHTIVKVVDPETEQVIQQIPSERFLEIAKSLASSTGLLVKQKA